MKNSKSKTSKTKQKANPATYFFYVAKHRKTDRIAHHKPSDEAFDLYQHEIVKKITVQYSQNVDAAWAETIMGGKPGKTWSYYEKT